MHLLSALTLVIVLIPGILATLVYSEIASNYKGGKFEFVGYSVFSAFISYLILHLVLCYFCQGGLGLWDILFAQSVGTSNIPYNAPYKDQPYVEVVYASGIAIVVAFIMATITNKKFLNTIAKKLRISGKYGNENLFSFYLGQRYLGQKETNWVYVTHKPKEGRRGNIYIGAVESYAESEGRQELVLTEASIYNPTNAELIRKAPKIYLCDTAGSFIIETGIDKRSP